MEGLIQHFELIMPNRGFETPRNEIYAAIESSNGELGYYLVADGGEFAWRVRTRPPSFIHFAVFPHIIKGHLLADVVADPGEPEHHRRRARPMTRTWTRVDPRDRPVPAAGPADRENSKDLRSMPAEAMTAKPTRIPILSEPLREKIRALFPRIPASGRSPCRRST